MSATTTVIPPFWRYYGGKHMHAGSYPLPMRDGLIVEPFAGSAGYACRHGAGRDVLLIDADPIIAGLWAWLIDASADDVLGIGDIPDGGTVDDLDAPQPARWLAGFWCNNGAARPCKTPSQWARLGANVHNWSGWSAKVRERVAAALPLIRGWLVIQGDYTAAPDVTATWFVDPPYQGKAGSHYTHGSASLDYAALGRWCETRTGRVIVCESAAATWMPWQGQRMLRATPGVNRPAKTADVVWSNQPDILGRDWAPMGPLFVVNG